jgi:hypothetical protein
LNRLAQYYTNVESLVLRRDRSKRTLLKRHFADPTYRIEVLNSSLEAEEAFEKAQLSVYLVAKAMEYKWPLNPETRAGITSLVAETVRARTASHLTSVMVELGTKDDNLGNSADSSRQAFYWNYSLRDDYLKMRSPIATPDGGERSAVEQFQDWLRGIVSDSNNYVARDGDENLDHVAIPFSTVTFDIGGGTGGGPRTLHDSSGTDQSMAGRPIFDDRLWDDKIDLVHVNIIGDNVYTPDPQTMPIELWYGGSGFVRTRDDLEINDPENPDFDVLDFIAYSRINWTLRDVPGGIGWKSSEFRTQALTAKLVTAPRDIPQDVFNTVNFRELPVAATGWQLLIPINDVNIGNIRDIEIIFIHKARTRPAKFSAIPGAVASAN